MRNDPETLTALARPLMSSEITVEIAMEAKESRASVPIAIPSRNSTESRSACEMEEMKITVRANYYPFVIYGYLSVFRGIRCMKQRQGKQISLH
ncbi:MAG: hypothetical protein QMD17_00935 [Rhodocyclaceae bacterium]|nr:hypothetical protein [Rhodocyclaceae bacterium]